MQVMDTDFEALLQKVYREKGLDLSQYKPSFVQRRLASRLRAKGISSYRAYMRMLDEEEYLLLMDTMTINLTAFFRDTGTYEALRDQVLRPLIRKRRQEGKRRLDIWSAGCASGEEPYSVAIILHQLLGRELSQWQIRILGTDIDPDKLAQAKKGVYNSFSFRGTKWPHIERYFMPTPQGKQLIPQVKNLVQFRPHDLITERPPGRFDMVICRNVLIYFRRSQQLSIFRKFHRALIPGGILVLGKTEILPPETASLFTPINLREHIHRKRGEHPHHTSQQE